MFNLFKRKPQEPIVTEEEKHKAELMLARITPHTLQDLRKLGAVVQTIESINTLGIDSFITEKEAKKMFPDCDNLKELSESINYWLLLSEKWKALEICKPQQLYTRSGCKLTLAEDELGFKHITLVQ